MSAPLAIDGVSGPAPAGATLFESARALGVRIPTSCHGQGKCRECLVEVEAGEECLSPRSEEEAALAERFRLACRARVLPGASTIHATTLQRGNLRIEERGAAALEVELDPHVERRSDGVWRGDERLDDAEGPLLGLAIDVGTTTVVARLHDLESGAALATRSFENPQRFAGSDVMARIRFDGEQGGRLLQRTLLAYLGHALEELPFELARVFEVVVVGNTTMRDLAFGLDVTSVGTFPYHSLTEDERDAGRRDTTAVEASARKLRLPLHARARVRGLPLVGGHVGADTAAALLATGVGQGDGLEVLMDLGTNTEVVAGNRERLLAASCPAGPAFEGGRIACGMPGFDGAIEGVRLGEGDSCALRVIGDVEPRGLCGTGLISTLGELRRTGRMNARGRYVDGASTFVLDGARGIELSEADVNELAQAKGANAAGLRAVLDLLGRAPEDVERFWLAGGFARHVDLDAARRIGLVPDLPDERFERAGNAALEGASLALLSRARECELLERVARIEHVTLESHPRFFDFFVDGCQLEELRA